MIDPQALLSVGLSVRRTDTGKHKGGDVSVTIGGLSPSEERAIKVTLPEELESGLVVINDSARTVTFHMDDPVEKWQTVLDSFQRGRGYRRQELLTLLRKLQKETERA